LARQALLEQAGRRKFPGHLGDGTELGFPRVLLLVVVHLAFRVFFVLLVLVVFLVVLFRVLAVGFLFFVFLFLFLALFVLFFVLFFVLCFGDQVDEAPIVEEHRPPDRRPGRCPRRWARRCRSHRRIRVVGSLGRQREHRAGVATDEAASGRERMGDLTHAGADHEQHPERADRDENDHGSGV